jgi:hypothetical protein
MRRSRGLGDVYKRQVYKRYYLFSELRKELTLEAIASMFNLNHSTIIHGLNQHDKYMKMNDRIYINW